MTALRASAPRGCLLFCLLLLLAYLQTSSFVSAQQDATCTSSRPCKVGCCSKYGSCGFGPAFCGTGNCTSTCDAKAECGQYAKAGDEKCPLNVCCSEFGFCGTTSSFCGKGCQNNCDAVKRPGGSGNSARARTIGYYESWSYARDCDSVAPEDIQASLWTHINFAFGLIDPSTFRLTKMHSYDDQLYPKVAALKMHNPQLKVFIAIGGWDAGGAIFSNMVGSATNRAAFIQSVIQFCATHGFDGVDIDWEYPVADDRGGSKADFANFVTFMKELQQASGKLGVTATLPSSYWYMKGFDIVHLEPYVDWFNFMSYDIHGTWDGNNPYTQQVVNPHTNLTEIQQGLDLLWRNNIPSNKVVLGIGFYGRSFTLSNPSCNKPGCPFSSGAKPGNCTKTSGVLSNAEIQRIIDDKNLKPTLDKNAGVKWITWDSDQWVSYDDADTLKMKMDFANNLGLGGTMVWAVDLDNQDSLSAQYLSSGGTMNDTNGFELKKKKLENIQSLGDNLGVWTPCMSEKDRREQGCPAGTYEVLVGHGKVFDSDTFHDVEGCHGKLNRLMCINNEVVTKNCHWNRNPDGSKLCDQSCPSGTFFLTQNSHPAGDKTDCAHGTYIAVCCDSILSNSEVCAAQYNADILFANGRSNMGNAKNSFTFDSGASKREVSDVDNETAAAKIAKRESTPYGDTHLPCAGSYGAQKMMQNPGQMNPALGYIGINGNNFVLYNGNKQPNVWGQRMNPKPTETVTDSAAEQRTRHVTQEQRYCRGDRYPQACANYRSIATNYGWRTVYCPENIAAFYPYRDAVRVWSRQHHASWRKYIQKRVYAPYANNAVVSASCQADEWPPYDLYGNRHPLHSGRVWVRYLPGGQNGGVANWGESRIRIEDCNLPIPVTTRFEPTRFQPGYYTDTIYGREHLTWTVTAFVMNFLYIPVYANDPDLLGVNECWPNVINAPFIEKGFAVRTDDQYYVNNPQAPAAAAYDDVPPPGATNGVSVPTKREAAPLQVLVWDDDTASFVVDDGNVTRPATPAEIAATLDLRKCADDACTNEKESLRQQAVDERRQAEFLREHGEEVQSMMIAGIRQPVAEAGFGESEMVVTEDPGPMWETTHPGSGSAPRPVRTPEVSVPTASVGVVAPEITGGV